MIEALKWIHLLTEWVNQILLYQMDGTLNIVLGEGKLQKNI